MHGGISTPTTRDGPGFVVFTHTLRRAPERSFTLEKIGGGSVRARWNRSGKYDFWDDLEEQRGIKAHTPLLGEISLLAGERLTHAFLCDIEGLLIREVQPWGNIQSRKSRILRPGLVVRCRGSWPLHQKVFRDDG